MAIYHLSVKAVSRSSGRTSTAAAAYRAGCQITDKRTGEVHDYSRKRGVMSADVVLPAGAATWAADREALWNAAEAAERRKDACVAREYEVALPSELDAEARRQLALDFAQEMADREGCAVDVAIHEPGKEGDSRNYHAHILRTTRKVEADGLGAKLDTEKAGRNRTADLEAVRARWAELTNERLQQHGIDARVDHRSLKEQGIDREPSIHLGPQIVGMERRGVSSEVKRRIDAEVADRLRAAQEQGKRERELAATNQSIIALGTDIAAAKAHRLQEKIAAFEERADKLVADREEAARLQAEQARQQAEQQRAEAFRAEMAKELTAGRALAELRKQKEAAQAIEQARAERARAALRQQQAKDRDKDRGYEPGGP